MFSYLLVGTRKGTNMHSFEPSLKGSYEGMLVGLLLGYWGTSLTLTQFNTDSFGVESSHVSSLCLCWTQVGPFGGLCLGKKRHSIGVCVSWAYVRAFYLGRGLCWGVWGHVGPFGGLCYVTEGIQGSF